MAQVSGLAFPFRIDPGTGGIARAAGAEKIRQNIRIVLATRLGERVMLRDYGTRLHSLVHDPNDEALIVLIRRELQQALLAWEPRALVTALTIGRSAIGEAGDPEATLVLDLQFTLTGEATTDRLLVTLG